MSHVRAGRGRQHVESWRAPSQVACGLAVALGVGAAVPPAHAQVADTIGFRIDSIKLVGDGSSDFFDDRFNSGITEADEVRLSNIDDCPLYNNEAGDAESCDVESAAGLRVEIKWSAPQNTYERWSVKIGTCAKASLQDDSATGCDLIGSPAEFSGAGANSFQVELARLIGTVEPAESEDDGITRACCADVLGRDQVVRLYLYLADTNTEEDLVDIIELPFEYDYKAPAAPTNVAADSKGQTVKVSWDKVSGEDEDNIEYRVYYGQEPFDSIATAGLSNTKVSGASSSATVSVGGEGTYYFSVLTEDDADNRSDLTPNVSAETIQTFDGFQYYKQAGGNDDGGFCFVATAAFGSYLDPHVEILRHFRDRVLERTAVGRGFVAMYYAHGDRWADVIRGNEVARGAARLALLPIVIAAWFIVEIGFVTKLTVLFGLALIVGLGRRWAARTFWTPAAPPSVGG